MKIRSLMMVTLLLASPFRTLLIYPESWFDHSRDLLHLVNHFRDEMLQPIVAVGHSMGASQLYELDEFPSSPK
jgi:predicted alpha/beta-fold hydrolase